jgi:hypothetical protein
MKKIAVLFSVVFIFSACSSMKEMSGKRAENRKSRKIAQQAEVKKAVEARRYIIKVDRLYSTRGGYIDLIPRSNFVIVNGEIASISLGYVGSSFSRPISGINFNARTSSYKMESNETRGGYKIQMSVKYGSDKFDVYLTIGTEGHCNISINNAYIQTVNYSGILEPIPNSVEIPGERRERM